MRKSWTGGRPEYGEPFMQPNLFTAEEVALRFRVSRRVLQAHLRTNPHYRLLGRQKLFTEADIARLYESLP
jgi:hypothetical protein